MSVETRISGDPSHVTRREAFFCYARSFVAGGFLARGLGYLLQPQYYSHPQVNPILPRTSEVDSATSELTVKIGGWGLILAATGLSAVDLAQARQITRRMFFVKTLSATAGVAGGVTINALDNRIPG